MSAQQTTEATNLQELNLRGGGSSDADSERTDNSDPPSPPSSTGHKSNNDPDFYDFSDADKDNDSEVSCSIFNRDLDVMNLC